MKQKVLLDTGPLVAIINRRETFHTWAKQEWGKIASPLLTCEAVVTEACFLLENVYGGKAAVISSLKNRTIEIAFNLSEELSAIEELMQRYQSVPMSFADACLVRMNELNPNSSLFTLDSDFYIYRKNRNERIDVIIPET